MKRILITGANRGLGLEFVRQGLQRGDRIFAGVREISSPGELAKLMEIFPQQLSLIELDVTDETSILQARKQISEQTDGLEVLVNNAGIFPRGETPRSLDVDTLLLTFHTNAIAPLIVVQYFLEMLKNGRQPKIVNFTSQMGSFEGKKYGGNYSYSGSKAALNMLTKTLAHDLKAEGITVVTLYPGWVQTDMGGTNAQLEPDQAIKDIISLVDRLTIEDTGKFLSKNGDVLPW